MVNELSENTRKIYLDFTPAMIEMTNYDELKKEVEKYVKRYEGMVFDRSEKIGATQARSELIALHDAIETERKKVKNVFNKPLDSFEADIAVLTTLINQPLNEIREGLKIIEEAEKKERESALLQVLEEKLSGVGLAIEEIQIDNKWLNKGMWTSKLKPTSKLDAEIENNIAQVIKEKERKATEEKILTEFCKAQNIEPAGWVSQLEHRNAMDVIALINLEKERQERIDAELIEKKKAHEEFLAEQQRTVQDAKQFLDDYQEPKQTISKATAVFSASLKIYGTVDQLNELNDFLVAKNMRVEEIQEEVEENLDKVASWDEELFIEDLPF